MSGPGQHYLKQFSLPLILLVLVACSAQDAEQLQAPLSSEAGEASTDRQVVVIQNQGSNMEGHTPRGFQGMGTGLFIGDNLNPSFPQGDGTQAFLTFNLSALPAGDIVSAVIRSAHAQLQGTPFQDLGTLLAEEIRYERFSPALWNLPPLVNGASCEFATSADGPYACNVTDVVTRSRLDGYQYAQLRLRLTEAGDSDGVQDMVFFYITEPNANQPGIFELEVTIEGG